MIKFLVGFLILIGLLVVWVGESRKFYCLDEDRYITVWKTFGDICYVVPGKYFGLIRPLDNYIKTTNTNYMTLYWTNQLPKSIVVRCEKEYQIFNEDKTDITIIDYQGNHEFLDKTIYIEGAKKFNDIKADAGFIDLIIKENYALDKTGAKL